MNDVPEPGVRTPTRPVDYHAPSPNRIGEMLRQINLLTDEQAQEAERYADEHGMRFGDAAVALGFIDQSTLQRALATQFDLRGAQGGVTGEPLAFTAPQSQAAEDYRSIRNALALRWFKHPQGANTLAVVSPQRGDGRSVMAANLAVCLAQVGFNTLLVDADMRNPTQHHLFNLDDRIGLSGYLAGRVDPNAFVEVPGIPSLTVMPAGGIPPNPQELLLRGMLSRLVDETRQRFEMVIFDTPAAEVGSDYQLIGAEAVGALIVTHREQTRTRGAKRLVESCRGFGIRIVGSAMSAAR
ncbi:MAG TPA: polysaccharide biosynthesis tyrosine autokinase [Sphingomonas sp.]|jgi:chain length determinant protein tyrosine kinase EpsG|uniref:polysaccharide biosynthesis tyrosine autokinase n=1 Tax=Sphingomonas sp. TaxID=28214 RepID=UPI002ED91E50